MFLGDLSLNSNCQGVLPKEIGTLIFSELHPSDLANCALANKNWHNLTNNPDFKTFYIKKLCPNLFGPEEWIRYFGYSTEAPSLNTRSLIHLLWSPSPYSKTGQRIAETHTLLLMPKGLSLKKFKEMAASPKEGLAAGIFDSISVPITEATRDQIIEESYWVLITNEVIEETKALSPEQQIKKIKIDSHYEFPGILVVSALLVSHYVRNGKCLLFKAMATCVEKGYWECLNYEGQLAVGIFAYGSYLVNSANFACSYMGALAVRKLNFQK